ncbi:hypothetical protein BRC83_05115 [Halobacteriales archaeon QS_1_68_17]|nr:MAG: hypothetical protein BRC83_05115 [Halobacteriales archaeon QS_1_68_17]
MVRGPRTRRYGGRGRQHPRGHGGGTGRLARPGGPGRIRGGRGVLLPAVAGGNSRGCLGRRHRAGTRRRPPARPRGPGDGRLPGGGQRAGRARRRVGREPRRRRGGRPRLRPGARGLGAVGPGRPAGRVVGPARRRPRRGTRAAAAVRGADRSGGRAEPDGDGGTGAGRTADRPGGRAGGAGEKTQRHGPGPRRRGRAVRPPARLGPVPETRDHLHPRVRARDRPGTARVGRQGAGRQTRHRGPRRSLQRRTKTRAGNGTRRADRTHPRTGGRDVTLPEGVERRSFEGRERLATSGPPAYGEPVVDGWRLWDAGRSKLGAMLDGGFDTGLRGGETVLYLGAAAGTTVSHVADFAGPTYAVEFAARPMRDLLSVARDRENLFPLLTDARRPETYAHVVEPVDVVIQDVATRGQARVALENRRFLGTDGRLIAAIKARSEDATRDPAPVFEDAVAELETGYEVLETGRLEPSHADHLGVVARPEDGTF